jgi:uncharacterized protein involved in exopolysaccharide biosynthesis
MTGPLKFKKKSVVPRVHYENVAYGKLRILWARKWLIAVLVVVALVLASVALVLLGPRYTGEAQIQINFTRDEPVNGAKIQPTATVDPAAVVEGAARIIRSRATADAVVARLGLDKDPTFTRQPVLWRVFSDARSSLGLEQSASSNHDLAVNRLMARISVTNDVRSYLILISVTSSDPALSATLANTAAFEYLRGQMLQQLTETYAAAEREVAELSSIYGMRHPSYLSGRTKLEQLQLRLRTLREGARDEDVARLVTGQSLIPAKNVLAPSGPNILLFLGLAISAALAIGIWLALLLGPDERLRPDAIAIPSKRTLEPIAELLPQPMKNDASQAN